MNTLSLTYLGNIEWFTRLFDGAVIDLGEHYIKQTFRNRCEIRAAGGREMLVVNVAGGAQRLAMKDVRIDYSKRWQHRHIEALRSAYGRAPFFDHYWEELERILSRRHEFLCDLNRELLEMTLRFLRCDITVSYSESYVEEMRHDFRSVKHRAQEHGGEPYWQGFGDWEPNLSIIDALMCLGPETTQLITKQMV